LSEPLANGLSSSREGAFAVRICSSSLRNDAAARLDAVALGLARPVELDDAEPAADVFTNSSLR
jgi:hypothetical protein